jgi:PPK2 family polyphosphate:nucleotide phosphotransferase
VTGERVRNRARLKPVRGQGPPHLGDRQARLGRGMIDRASAKAALPHELARAAKLQAALSAEGTRALLVVLQGRDASGKDGTVRQVIGAFNPQDCAVTAFKQPTALERRHDYLWRVHGVVPAAGEVGVFNRSHYEDVLVPRVHGMISSDVCQRRYGEINDFERMLAANGVTILKFFLHVSRAEQGRRLAKRLRNPEKNWKYDALDLAERARWSDYTRAYAQALRECSTSWAPWYIVPADDKAVRNLLVARTIVATLARMAPKYPRGDKATIGAARKLLGL